MNWNTIQGNWKQLVGRVKQEWGDLTDNEIASIEGSRDRFEGLLQERYGIAQEEAARRIDEWIESLDDITSRAD